MHRDGFAVIGIKCEGDNETKILKPVLFFGGVRRHDFFVSRFPKLNIRGGWLLGLKSISSHTLPFGFLKMKHSKG